MAIVPKLTGGMGEKESGGERMNRSPPYLIFYLQLLVDGVS
jgi:hypothetical protein